MGAESSKVSPTTTVKECRKPVDSKGRKELLFKAIEVGSLDCIKGVLTTGGEEVLKQVNNAGQTPLEYANSLKVKYTNEQQQNTSNISNIIAFIEYMTFNPDADLADFELTQSGGASYEHKYLKYKSKYLALKRIA